MIKFERTLTVHLETPAEIALHAEALQVAAERSKEKLSTSSWQQLERARRELALGAKSITLSQGACNELIDALGDIEAIAEEALCERTHRGTKRKLAERAEIALDAQAAFKNLMEEPERSIGVAP